MNKNYNSTKLKKYNNAHFVVKNDLEFICSILRV